MNKNFVIYIYQSAKIVFTIILVILLVRAFLIEPGKVNGRSMESTYLDEDVFLVNKFSYLFSRAL